MLKSIRHKRVLEKQHEALHIIPRTRVMPHYKKPNMQPGPEVYSIKAAEARERLTKTGPMNQSTVDLKKMKGERSGFIYNKHWTDY